ncbi:MAG: acyl-CoA dehydrogenase family protein [Sphingomonadales bacterium]
MQLDFTPEELAFRDEVRAFIAEHYPRDLRAKQDAGLELDKEDYLSWHRVVAKKGWVAPGWPAEYGGTGWTPTQRHIWAEERGRADCVPIMGFSVDLVGPVIYSFGTPEQKALFLPRILSGEDWWCQGYSEPGAGSDLASLKTKAVRDGDDYIVNGQKTWTTYAQFADWGFFLVRTDPHAKKQEGISFLLIDMKSPGVTVRPIITLDGAHEVNEVWLEDVRVPVANRVHEENKGWTCAKVLLAHERGTIAMVPRSKAALAKLRSLAAGMKQGGRSLADDPFFKRKLTEIEIDLMALAHTELRLLAAENAGKAPGFEASLLKIKGTDVQQRIDELALESVGSHAAARIRRISGSNEAGLLVPEAIGVADTYFNGRKTSIFGGSNEIQRNIIAKRVLGL